MGSRRGVKYCQNCGTMHDLNYTNTCSVCGQPIRTEEQRRRDKVAIAQAYIERRKAKYQAMYDELAELQKDLPPLTGDEWQKAVGHFKGCAMCSSPEVAARVMLVDIADGGGYNRGNIIPVCEKCAIASRSGRSRKSNWVNRQMSRYKRTDKQALQRLVDAIEYLKEEAQHD